MKFQSDFSEVNQHNLRSGHGATDARIQQNVHVDLKRYPWKPMWHLRCYYVPHPINSITRLLTRGIPGAGINRPAAIRPLMRVAARDRAPFADYGRRAGGSQQRRPALAALIETVGFAV